jgi:hypothetical protein
VLVPVRSPQHSPDLRRSAFGVPHYYIRPTGDTVGKGYAVRSDRLCCCGGTRPGIPLYM